MSGNCGSAGGTIRATAELSERGNAQGLSMQRDRTKSSGGSESLMRHPALIAVAVAVFGLLAMLIVDHGPWRRPKPQSAHVAIYKTTGEAARGAGAIVTPTEPKSKLEPATPGPIPAKPINPASP